MDDGLIESPCPTCKSKEHVECFSDGECHCKACDKYFMANGGSSL